MIAAPPPPTAAYNAVLFPELLFELDAMTIEGAMEGVKEGEREGVIDGNTVGSKVGLNEEGKNEGKKVGEKVGLVGARVGGRDRKQNPVLVRGVGGKSDGAVGEQVNLRV